VDPKEAAVVVSLVISCITLAVFVWGFGYRWGRLQGQLSGMQEKLDMMYRIFVENALTLQNKMGMISRASPYKLTDKGKALPSLLTLGEMKGLKRQSLSNTSLFVAVVSTKGMESIVDHCLSHDLTVSQAVATTIVEIHSCEDSV
jgi:hypothetical protein